MRACKSPRDEAARQVQVSTKQRQTKASDFFMSGSFPFRDPSGAGWRSKKKRDRGKAAPRIAGLPRGANHSLQAGSRFEDTRKQPTSCKRLQAVFKCIQLWRGEVPEGRAIDPGLN